MTGTKHVDVLLYMNGKYFHVAHADLPIANDAKAAGSMLSDLLHQAAWEVEEIGDNPADAGVEDLGDNCGTPSPRKVTTPQGLVYWEVAPGEFVYGWTWESAVARFNQKGLSTSEQGLRGMYPEARWENL